MSANAPAVSLKAVGDSVAGRIAEFDNYQVTHFADDPKNGVKKGDLKFFPSGDPIMGVKVVLETSPGDAGSRVTLWAEKPNMLRAIAAAVRAQGATDLELGADLAVTFSGFEGRAHSFQAAYARADSVSGD
jgi:hypothetical protein